MKTVAILTAIGFIFFDLFLLKKENRELARRVFIVPFWFVWAVGVLGALMLSGGDVSIGGMAAFVTASLLPLYLVQRSHFLKALAPLPPGEGIPRTEIPLSIEASGVFLGWMFGMLLFSFFLSFVNEAFSWTLPELTESVVAAVFSSLLMLFLILRVAGRHPGPGALALLGLQTRRQSFSRLFLFPALVGILFAAVSSWLIYTRTDQPQTPFNEIIESTTSTASFMVFFVVAILMAPFLEEIIFRGFFFYVIKQYRGKVFAVVFVSLVFAGLHYEQYWGDAAAILMVTLLGFALTLLRARTGSSVASMVAHYFYNGAMFVFPVIFMLLSNPSYFQYQLHFSELENEVKEELLRESIRHDPSHAPSYNDLAWLLAQEERDLPEALRLVDRALSLDPDSFAFLDTKAEVLYKMEKFHEAYAVWQDLAARYPTNRYLDQQLEKVRRVLQQTEDR